MINIALIHTIYYRIQKSKYCRPIVCFCFNMLLPFVAGLLLFNHTISDALIAGIISVGLDPLRSQFIAALLLTAGATLIGGALSRNKSGAITGGTLLFCTKFYAGFIHQQLIPAYDPGGHVETLNINALLHDATFILGLGILSAFIGTAVGNAIGDVVFCPLYKILRILWHTLQTYQIKSAQEAKTLFPYLKRTLTWSSVGKGLGAVGIVLLIILAINSSDLFIISPDNGIHKIKAVDANGKTVMGTVEAGSFISTALRDQQRLFMIYLPPSYKTPAGQNKRYPVLYLLHGSPGQPIDWVTGGKAVESADTLIAAKKIPELIMVIPDGNGRPKEPSQWANSGDQKQLMEKFVASELVRYVDQHYRTLPTPDKRAIGGLSMGGFGAVNIAIHHPEIFGSMISLGGYYEAEGTIWGKNPYYRQANSPTYTALGASQLKKQHIYLGAATRDQPYYGDTINFMRELNQLHVSYQVDIQKGYHAWPIWQKQMYDALLWLKWDVEKPAE